MKKLLVSLAAVMTLVGCAGTVKRSDGSQVPKETFVCAEGKEIAVSLHDNIAHLYLGMSRKELKRQPMKDGMIIFSNGKYTLSYKSRSPILNINGKDYGQCIH